MPGTLAEPDGVAQSPWIEQERRIFYVGLTRAADQALLHPVGRPSRFLAELTPPKPGPPTQPAGVKKRARKPPPEQRSA